MRPSPYPDDVEGPAGIERRQRDPALAPPLAETVSGIVRQAGFEGRELRAHLRLDRIRCIGAEERRSVVTHRLRQQGSGEARTAPTRSLTRPDASYENRSFCSSTVPG